MFCYRVLRWVVCIDKPKDTWATQLNNTKDHHPFYILCSEHSTLLRKCGRHAKDRNARMKDKIKKVVTCQGVCKRTSIWRVTTADSDIGYQPRQELETKEQSNMRTFYFLFVSSFVDFTFVLRQPLKYLKNLRLTPFMAK